MNKEEEKFFESRRQVAKKKFEFIRYCKKKLSDKGVCYIFEKPLHLCKHKVIIRRYEEFFKTIALNDYQSYLSTKKDKQNAYI